ncbi:MAG: porin family protein [Gemmatimonadota bacterium]|nr:porin family protein [Gemmatimonadota bacterium]
MTSRTLRSLLCVSSCALTAATTSSEISAQQVRNVVVGFSGGASIPTGEFGMLASKGYEIGVHLFVAPHDVKKNLSFRGDLSYDRWSGKAADVGKFRGIGMLGNAVYALGSRNMMLRPYALAGAGVHNFQRSFPTNTGDAGTGEIGDTKIAAQGGAGVQFDLRGFAAFLEGRYVYRFGESKSNWIPVSLGFHF